MLMHTTDKQTLCSTLAALLFLQPPLQAPSPAHHQLKSPITFGGAGPFLADLHTIHIAASSFVRPAALGPISLHCNVNLVPLPPENLPLGTLRCRYGRNVRYRGVGPSCEAPVLLIPNNNDICRICVSTTALMNSSILGDTPPCSPLTFNQPATYFHVGLLLYSSTLKAAFSFETSVEFQQTIRCYIPECYCTFSSLCQKLPFTEAYDFH